MEIHPSPFPSAAAAPAGRIHLVFFGRCERKLFPPPPSPRDRPCSCWSKIHSHLSSKLATSARGEDLFATLGSSSRFDRSCRREIAFDAPQHNQSDRLGWPGVEWEGRFHETHADTVTTFFKKIALAPCGNNSRSRSVLSLGVLRGEGKHIQKRSFAPSNVD